MPDVDLTTDVPARIDHFRVAAPLAEGGTGVVYAAIDEESGARVALKVMRRELADPESALRLLGQARSLRGVRHPNLVSVLDAGLLPDGRCYLVMERLEGKDLRSILAERGTLHPKAVVRLARELAGALDALHG